MALNVLPEVVLGYLGKYGSFVQILAISSRSYKENDVSHEMEFGLIIESISPLMGFKLIRQTQRRVLRFSLIVIQWKILHN